MLSEKDSVEIRQIGRFFWNIYQGCLESGFSEPQAFKITLQWASGLATNKSDMSGPPSDMPE